VGAVEGEECSSPTTVLVATLQVVEIIYRLIGDDKSKISWKGCVLDFVRRNHEEHMSG
jgi:hypothetical protein